MKYALQNLFDDTRGTGGGRSVPGLSMEAIDGTMAAGRVWANAANVRPSGCVPGVMLVWTVVEIRRLNLVGLPHLRIGTWKGAESEQRVVENLPVVREEGSFRVFPGRLGGFRGEPGRMSAWMVTMRC